LPWRRRAVRAADLGHLDAGGLQDLGQARTVTRRPFYSGDRDRAEAAGPRQRVSVTGWTRRELAVCQRLSGVGDNGKMDGVQMGVHADDDAR
jgi:hypothetical protein